MSILARLRGRIEEKGADWVILFAGGLGFEVQVPLSTLTALPEAGEETTLRTYLHVREGALGLYGFLTAGEQRMFELLLTVTGVGPRAALNCLSLARPEQLAGAIAAGDAQRLPRIPGVGPKTVNRILLELKGRVADLPQEAAVGGSPSEVMEALLSLGFSSGEAAAAIAALPRDEGMSDMARIQLALQSLAPRSEPRRRER